MGCMTHITEAIYLKGVLKPIAPLQLQEEQRVRLIVEPISGDESGDREAALARLRADIDQGNLRLPSPLPSRDELHDRF